MSRTTVLGTCLLCFGAAIGCGRAAIAETGCVTAAGDRFVLTALETSDTAGSAQTETYQLVADDDKLRPFVGKAVRVTGMAKPAQIAEVSDVSPAAPVGTSGEAGAEAKVGTSTQTRIETRRLHVQSMVPIEGDCTTGTP